MVNGLPCRRALEKVHEGLVAKESFRERTQMGIFHVSQDRHELLGHLVRIGLTADQEILRGRLAFIDAGDILNPDLHPALVKRALTAHAHEVIPVKGPAELFRPLPHPRLDLAAAIHELESQVAAPVLGHAMVLDCDQED